MFPMWICSLFISTFSLKFGRNGIKARASSRYAVDEHSMELKLSFGVANGNLYLQRKYIS